jgi:5-methylcytosine-specific restriction endonuclease McrA
MHLNENHHRHHAYERNLQRSREYQKKRREDPEFLEDRREYQKQYREKNKEVLARDRLARYEAKLKREGKTRRNTGEGRKGETLRKWREERGRAWEREYRQQPEQKKQRAEYAKEYQTRPEVRERRRQQNNARRANMTEEQRYRRNLTNRLYRQKKRDNGGDLTADQWIEIMNLYDNRCLACGSDEDITLDHIVPVSLGGKTDRDNVQPLCRSCNSSKWQKIVDYRPEHHAA